MNICVIGTDLLGLSTAMLFSHLGHFVVLVDDNETKIDLLKSNAITFSEPYFNDFLYIFSSHIFFSTNLTQAIEFCDAIFFCGGEGYKFGEVANIVSEIAKENFKVIINKDTSEFGTTKRIQEIIESKTSNFSIALNPSFYTEGQMIRNIFYPELILIGSKDAVVEKCLKDIYDPIVRKTMIALPEVEVPYDTKLLATDITSAELSYHGIQMLKSFHNDFVFDLSKIGEDQNANMFDVVKILNESKEAKDIKLSSFPKDGKIAENSVDVLLSSLSFDKLNQSIIKNIKNNELLYLVSIIERLKKEGLALEKCKISVIGMANGAGQDSIDNSPGLKVSKLLVESGAIVKFFDPKVGFKVTTYHKDLDLIETSSIYDLFWEADVMIFCHAVEECNDLDWFKFSHYMKQQIILDLSDTLDRDDFKNFGYKLIRHI